MAGGMREKLATFRRMAMCLWFGVGILTAAEEPTPGVEVHPMFTDPTAPVETQPAPAPGPAAETEPPPGAVPVSNAVEYRVRAGDLLQIWVFGQPDLSQPVRVSPTGRVDVPFVGSLDVLDKTTEEVAANLAAHENLNRQVNRPVVSVSVKEYAPMNAFVLGAVTHPQQFELPMDLPMTVTQAIAQAEGFREDASRTTVRVYRRDRMGRTKTLEVNVAEILDAGKPEADLVLQPGDTVYVSPRASGGVFVLGAVIHPGFFELRTFNRGGDNESITVTQALAASGGFTEDAVEEGVRLFRRKGTGGEIELQQVVNVTQVTGGDKMEGARIDPVLKAGDTVYVPPRDKIFVVGRVIRAGAYSAPQGQTLTVTKAISLAGGFDPYAERGAVKIFRRESPDAPPEIVDVKRMFSSGDLRSDSVVKPGDLVFVPESIW